MSAPDTERRPRLRRPTEGALIGVSVATVVGLGPLFDDRSYVVRLLVVVAAAHAVTIAARTLHRGLVTAAAASTLTLVLVVSWLFEPRTTWYGLAGRSTWHATGTDLGDAWSRFQHVVAPAHPTTGFLVATAVALWIAIFLADWAAFRLSAPFEAIVPTGGLFLFAAILGADNTELATTAVYLAAVLGFLLLHRVAREETAVRWVGSGTGRGTRSLLATGAVVATIALGVGLVVGPHLPGATAPALLSLDDRGGGGPRVTLSPLVDIKARLIRQRDVEVFTVHSPVPAYWRLTSLDRFDGQIWSSGGTFEHVRGALPNGPAPDRSSRQVEQRFDIGALSTIWLPAAFEPLSVDAGRLDVRWEPASSTLIVDADRATSDEISYHVVSSVPEYTPAQLEQAGTPPSEIRTRYTALPRDFSETARRTARRVVDGTNTLYDRALALQNFFRDGFTYSTSVPAGHSANAVDAFLERRTGFCEQFAGTFAAMARSVGLPSRVAVGFTPGEQDDNDPTLFHVRGKHAHAWPEVYLGGYGWVAFEPTPGRGAPGAEAYTGVPARQETTSPADTTIQGVTTVATAPTIPAETDSAATTVAAPAVTARAGSNSPWAGRFAAISLILVLLGGAYVVLTAVGVAAHRGRRRLAARRGPVERTKVAWLDAADALGTVGLVAEPSETPVEFSIRAAGRLETASAEHRSLAVAVTEADYAEEGVSAATAEQATQDARAVVNAVRRRSSAGRQMVAHLGWGWGRWAGRQSSRRNRSRMR